MRIEGNRCHQNGLGTKGGRPRYVTALGATNEPARWRANKAKGGIVMDVHSGEVDIASSKGRGRKRRIFSHIPVANRVGLAV